MIQGTSVESIEALRCDAGWRNYHYLKLTTADGVVGWAEFDEGFGSPGVSYVIESLAGMVIGRSAMNHEQIYQRLFARTRPGSGGVVGQAIGAIENALLDAKARTLGVPCYELLGGQIRDRIRVYWSHCGTWRVNLPQHYGDPITDLGGIRELGAEVREAGFTALKTNIFRDHDGRLRGWIPGFGTPFEPGLNVEKQTIRDLRAVLESFIEGAGPDIDILLDLNFNARTEGNLRIIRALADLDLFWVEIDTDSPDGLALVRQESGCPISGGETLFGNRQLLPYLQAGALDVPIIDGIWNGFWQSMKMAATAEGFQASVAPHNFYGHLCTMMNAHFAAAVPNLRIMETDIDRLPWDDDLVTNAPVFEDGHLILGEEPGWGTQPIEEALAAHPPQNGTGLLSARRHD
ncbi:MAG: mandelate racemase/muconate lactonizing enzyme family protein [Actinomycetia bacterium]|nr:mandelate racemase/muconate lactonizing enzyme family protein [Actinomycetes bacterium]